MPVRSVSFEVAAEERDRDDENLLDVALRDRANESLDRSMMFREPSQGGFARLTVAMAQSRSVSDSVLALDRFLRQFTLSVKDVKKIDGYADRDDFVDVDWLWDLVEDYRTDFDIDSINSLVSNVMKEFTGFPTNASSGSTGSRGNRGTSSTADSRPKGSTRSRSTRAVSPA